MDDLDKAARNYANQFIPCRKHEPYANTVEDFKAGHAFALSKASEGFDRWEFGQGHHFVFEEMTPKVIEFEREAWIAARLSAESELTEKIRVAESVNRLMQKQVFDLENEYREKLGKQREAISQLEMVVKKINDDYWFMINLIERYSSNKEDTLKDVLARMKFRKPLLEKSLTKVEEVLK
jgi:hypothetical protein